METSFCLKYGDKNLIVSKEKPCTIGRDPNSDIVLSSSTVSRKHAVITLDDANFIIEDLGSKNGTFINEKQITNSSLKDKDVIKIGDIYITVVEDDGNNVQDMTTTRQDSMIIDKYFNNILNKVKDDDNLVEDLTKTKRVVDASRKKLKNAANIDSLTQIFNRRYFDETLHREIMRDARYGHSLSLLLLDIDHFKHINDEFGHQQGDQVLRWVATKLKSITRQTDIVARYGGEEFVLMLTETEIKNASHVAEKIRLQIERESSKNNPKKFTVSIGVAAYPIHGSTDKYILKAADTALYSSKQNGRNQVTICEWQL